MLGTPKRASHAGSAAIATCLALFFSGFGDLVLLGAVNLVGVIAVVLLTRFTFTSVWCASAAVVSASIFFHFHRRRGDPVLYAKLYVNHAAHLIFRQDGRWRAMWANRGSPNYTVLFRGDASIWP